MSAPTTSMARSMAGSRDRWGTAVLLLVTVVGLGAFLWPFFATPEIGVGHAHDAPWLFALVFSLLGLNLLAEQSSGRLDAKTVAVLGVLAALGAGLRVLSAGVAGLEPMFFLIVVAGRVLGRRLAFLSGALTMLVSAFLTGAVGPWTPFQMVATGWVALGAALLPRTAPGWRERVLLAVYGMAAGLGYGVVMNLWFWPFIGGGAGMGGGVDGAGATFVAGAPVSENLAHYAVFYVATSLGWDLPRGLLTAFLCLVAAHPILVTLRRAVVAASFDSVATFAGASGPAADTTTAAAAWSDPAPASTSRRGIPESSGSKAAAWPDPAPAEPERSDAKAAAAVPSSRHEDQPTPGSERT